MKTRLEDLIKTLKKLRDPDGCSWNKEQTHETLIPYLLEETYEVIEAIENKDFELLKEELGDLLLHIIFQAELADEKKHFNIYDTIFNINQKLINRKPHIFLNPNDENWKPGKWETAKKIEKNRNSVLEGVPKALPSLTKARRIQEKAAGVGFDWDNLNNVFDKIYEELDELKDALKSKKATEEFFSKQRSKALLIYIFGNFTNLYFYRDKGLSISLDSASYVFDEGFTDKEWLKLKSICKL